MGGKLVATIDSSKIAEELVVEEVVPTQGRGDVTPAEVRSDVILLAVAAAPVLLFKIAPEAVVPTVETQEDPALGRENVVEFGIEIVEVVAALLVAGEKGTHQQIDVGASSRDNERGPVFAQRPLQG